jgi:putative ABC transport system permease protein
MLGETVSLNGTPHLVIGITAPGVETESPQPIDIWIPFQIDPATTEQDHYLTVAGRIRPGVTPAMIRTQLQLATDEFRRRYPGVSTALPGTTFIAEPMLDVLDRKIRPSLLILAVAVSFVLLIACANVANLLLVRASGRKREIAIRIAVGASRTRLIRQLLSESVALSLIGGILGLILGMIGIRALLSLNPGSIPRIGEHGSAVIADWHVITFTLLLSIATGIFFGLIPAFQASRIELSAVPRKTRIRAALVVSEVSLALVLLIGSGLLIRSFLAMRSVNPGFNTHKVLTLEMSLTGEQFQKTVGLARLVDSSLERIRALPGVEFAAAGCCLPIRSGAPNAPFVILGRPLTGTFHARANMPTVSASYFDVFEIPLLRGRKFTQRDNAGAPKVAIINQSMAHQFWPDGDAIDAQISLGKKTSAPAEAFQIIGIAGDVRERTDRSTPPGNTIYLPLPQTSDDFTAFIVRNPTIWIVRTRVEPHTLISSVKTELVQASGGLPTIKAQSMDEVLTNSTAREDFNTVLMLVFGTSALLLAAIGIYGLMAHSVQQRTQEMGIRMALGAQCYEIRNLVVWQAMRSTLLGVTIGTAAAWSLTRFIKSFLFEVKPLDPIVFMLVPALLCSIALFAAWLPARRAGRIDPIDALRHE